MAVLLVAGQLIGEKRHACFIIVSGLADLAAGACVRWHFSFMPGRKSNRVCLAQAAIVSIYLGIPLNDHCNSSVSTQAFQALASNIISF